MWSLQVFVYGNFYKNLKQLMMCDMVYFIGYSKFGWVVRYRLIGYFGVELFVSLWCNIGKEN